MLAARKPQFERALAAARQYLAREAASAFPVVTSNTSMSTTSAPAAGARGSLRPSS
ncbi:hypothetical protein [Streptomyces mayteni]